MQISFYNVKSTPIDRALPVLLQKALDANMTPSVLVPQGQTATYSTILWQGGGVESFLAHDIGDKADEKTPIKVTDTPDFDRDIRFYVNHLQMDWIQGANAIYFVFDSDTPTIVENARSVWRTLQQQSEYTLSYYQQHENGKWVKK